MGMDSAKVTRILKGTGLNTSVEIHPTCYTASMLPVLALYAVVAMSDFVLC